MKAEKKYQMSKYLSTLESFKRINSEALEIIGRWRNSHKNVIDKINANGTHDVVTEVDIAIEELTNKICQEFTPGIKVFGEESFKQDFSTTTDPFYIVVDPIDGTKEFVNGSIDWSISICAVENGTPVVASIYMPDRNEVFTALKSLGIKLNGIPLIKGKDGINKKIAVSPRQIGNEVISEMIMATGYEPIKIPALTPKVCAILRGDVSAAVYFKQDGQSATLWDYAASVLLINEFGGKISSLTGQDLPFIGSKIIHKDGWVAINDLNEHSKLLLSLNRVCL